MASGGVDWFVFAVLTSVLWGVIPFLEKTAITIMPDPFAAATMRAIGAILGASLIPIFSPATVKTLTTAPMKAWLCLLAAGFIGSFVGQLTNLTALRHGEVSRVTPITGSWPLIACLIAFLFLGEPLSLKKVAAIVLVVGGVVLSRI